MVDPIGVSLAAFFIIIIAVVAVIYALTRK
jgi:hypothetical protein